MDAARGLREREIGVLRQQLELVPDNVRARILLAADYAAVGLKSDAIRELERAVEMRPNDANILYNAACTYGVMQIKDEALTLVRKTLAVGYTNLDWMARDPDLACLHGDPDFQRLLKDGERRA
jgi:non-specific serine/threonine protein kinase